MAPSTMWLVLAWERGVLCEDRHVWRGPCKRHKGKGEPYPGVTPTSHGVPRLAGKLQKLRGKKDLLGPSGKVWPSWHLDFGLLAPRIETTNLLVLIHPVMILCYSSPRKLKQAASYKFWYAVFSFFSVQNIFCFPLWYLWPIGRLIDWLFIHLFIF